MAKATLTVERARELLDYDPETGEFKRKVATSHNTKVGDVAYTIAGSGYLQIYVDGKRYYAHRLAWFMVYGEWPTKHVDHVNCDKTDNRIENLRLATHAQNMQNRPKPKRVDNTSGFKGVSLHKASSLWRARIMKNRRNVYLAYFRCPTAAHIAYCKAAKEHFGEYARTA